MKNRVFFPFWIWLRILLVFCAFTVAAADYSETGLPRTVKVGWYDYPGFYMTDKDGYRNGYVYDYWQEIARYTGWRYEYVTGTAEECLRMLEDGSIDMLGSVMYSPDRARTMRFSDMSLGKNYSVITTRADNTRYQPGKYADFDGIRIGVLSGDIRQEHLKKHAADKGYTYIAVQQPSVAQLEKALFAKEVDAILTTSMRVGSSDEGMIAQFAPQEFYIAVKKGSDLIMDAVNAAMEQIEFYRKGFQSELAQKYFSVDMSGSYSLTVEEKDFIAQNPVIKVLYPVRRKPLSYLENGECRGIIADIMKDLSARMGITFDYVPVPTYPEGIAWLAAGRADMIISIYNDYGYAETNHILLSRPYMTLNFVSVARNGEDLSGADIRVAAMRGYRFSQDYVERRFIPEQISWFANEQECIDAVRDGKADICFVNSYTAGEYLMEYRYRNLFFSFISYNHGISAGIPADGSPLLLSLLDKAISGMGENKISAIIDNNSLQRPRPFSMKELILRFPLQFMAIFGSFGLTIATLLIILILTRYRRRKNDEVYQARLAAERDCLTGLYNRIVYEVIVTQELQKHRKQPHGFFVMLDIDNFKQLNDLNGHLYGDRVLTALADGLRRFFSPGSALLCRMGGDEFSLFLTEPVPSEDAARLLGEIRQKLADGTAANMAICCSMGFAPVSEQLGDFSSLYEAADRALYCAKNNGKGRVCSYEEAQNDPVRRRRKTDFAHTKNLPSS